MPRVLHLDCSEGITPEQVAAALVDLGLAPSPIIFAVAPLSQLAELRFDREPEGARVRIFAGPEPGPLLTLEEAVTRLRRGGLSPKALALAETVLRRMAEACEDAGEPFTLVEDEAPDSLLGIAAAAAALAEAAPDQVRAGRLEVGTDDLSGPLVVLLVEGLDHLHFDLDPERPTSLGGAALLDVLAGLGRLGDTEPPWRGFTAHGRGLDPLGSGRRLTVRLGEAL
ncbi:MAG TPA: nickel insertion protein [Candidatus Thermoplasmatota archaeon]|nr:nickel insertion protein [Candidatus Thermoplasmatota archaeon]